MTEKRTDLLKKIKALLSKTIEAGCTESEAMAALQRAQAMMDIYEVTDEELQLTKEEKAIIRKVSERDPYGVKRGLGYAVNKFTGTESWTYRNGEERSICGLPADVEFAEWLLNALDAHVKREYVRYAITSVTGDGKERRTAMLNFIRGCTGRVSERLIELAKPPKQQTSNSRALVVTKQGAIATCLEAAGICLGSSRGSTINVKDVAAYEAGKVAGDRASFGRPVTGKASVLRLEKK
jgi:hypothetical protein